MIEVVAAFLKNHWATLAGWGAFFAACLVGIRDWFTIRKLQLELKQLANSEAQRDSRIVEATLEEIEKYAPNPFIGKLYSRRLHPLYFALAVILYSAGLGVLYVLGFARLVAMLLLI